MYRKKLNIKTENEQFKAELYRNRREKIGDIPNDYIGKVKRTSEDIDFFDISIPKHIQVKDKKKINPIYMKIKPMQHIIVTTIINGEEKKERFILTEPKSNRTKNNGEKSFKAVSFENTLKNKRTSFEGKVIQLKSDNIHIAEGILDKFARETGWRLGYIDPKSRVEYMATTEKINVDLFNNFSKTTKVTEGALLFEKDITTTIAEDRPLYIFFEYKNLTTYDNGKELMKTPSIFNTLTDALYTNIKKVQAYHYSDVGNRYGIRYVFTLTDNTTVERIAVFTNIINKTFICENIRFTWETGNIIETENVKYINIENIDSDWYETLRSLQDNFKSVFLFDSYNKSLNVVHRDNLGEEKPYILTYDNAIIDIEDNENTEYLTGLKVIGKDGLSIVSENIYGDDIVRNYNEHIRLGVVSEELQIALERYEAVLTTKQEEWLNIKNNILTEQQKQTRLSSEVKALSDRIKNLRSLLAGYINGNDTTNQARIKSEIDELENRLNQCNALILQYAQNISLLNDESAVIIKDIKKENVVDNKGKIFTDVDLEELNDIEQIGAYEDDYYTNSFALLNVSKKVLEDRIKPQIDFNINCINLCKIIHHSKGWNFILELGSLFKFDDEELKTKLGEDTVRLVEYEYEPKTNTISNLIFTNRTHKYDITRSLADLGKKTNTTNDLLNSLRPIIDDAMLSNDFVAEVLRNGLDMSAYNIKARSYSNYIDFGEAGLFMYDQGDMNKCIYVGSSIIAISTDGFLTSETAISSEGILAKLLVGSVILGNKLYITSEDGQFYIGNMDEKQGFGLSIKDSSQNQRVFLGTEIDSDGVRRAKLRLLSKDGRETVLDENGILNSSQSQVSENISSGYDFEIPFIVDEGVNSLKKVQLTLMFSKYRGYTRGSSAGGGTVATSSDGGGFSYGSTSGAGGYYYSQETSEYSDVAPYQTYTSDNIEDSQYDTHVHTYWQTVMAHVHNFIINIPSHFHYFSVSQPAHSHNTTLKDHTHTEVHGIYVDENSGVQNAKIYINGNLVAQNINSEKYQIDITSHLKLNDTNYIRISNNKNVRVCVNLYEKKFVSW